MINVGSSFSEPGYSVSDNYSSSTIMNQSDHKYRNTSSLNTNQIGTGLVYYIAVDENGNWMKNWITRTVIVQNPTISLTLQ
jgi:hypothetical protein